MLVIGDVHGKVNAYWKLIQKHNPESSIQVGDFGFQDEHDWFLRVMDCEKHKVNFGNHEYMPYLNRKHSMGDMGHIVGKKCGDIVTFRGAKSIDASTRLEGYDWFSNEEIEYTQWLKNLDDYEIWKPKVVISHDCPRFVSAQLFDIDNDSTTAKALEEYHSIHAPDLWVFGHYHKSKNEVMRGTRFICLDKLETITI